MLLDIKDMYLVAYKMRVNDGSIWNQRGSFGMIEGEFRSISAA